MYVIKTSCQVIQHWLHAIVKYAYRSSEIYVNEFLYDDAFLRAIPFSGGGGDLKVIRNAGVGGIK